jgi:hypothetical protein
MSNYNTKNLVIRRATLADANIISLLARITFDETFGHLFRQREDLLNYFDSTFSVQKIEKSIQKPHTFYWMAHYDKLPIGYAKLKLNSTNEFIKEEKSCQLQKIYILKDFISHKIGLHLQNKLIETAKKNNSNIIWLSVLKENSRAIHFYKKNEFKIIGAHDFQIGIENFNFNIMSKKI